MTNLLEKLSIDVNEVQNCPDCGAHALRWGTALETFPSGMVEPATFNVEVPVLTCSKCSSSYISGLADEIVSQMQLQLRLTRSALG
jgi:hypothetical protein